MKHQVTKFALTLLASFTLAACSSSGGSGDNNETAPARPSIPSTQPSTPSTQPSTPSTQPSTPSTQPSMPSTQPSTPSTQPSTPSTQPSTPSTQPSTPSTQPSTPSTQPSTPSTQPSTQPSESPITAERVGFMIPKAGGAVSPLYLTNVPTNVNILHVEEKTIEIIPEGGIHSANIININSSNIQRYVGGTNYKNIRWGSVTESSLTAQYLISIGVNPTADMPTTGNANYVGNGVHGYSRNGSVIDDIAHTNVTLTANFADKTLEGTISIQDRDIDDIKLSAKIAGNNFNGTIHGVQTEGRFYGNNASELTGSYINNEEKYLGVYGARKQ